MKTPEQIAREIVGPCEFPEAPCTSKGRHPSLCTRCGIAPGVAAAIREAEDRATKAENAFYALWSVSGDAIKAAKDPERNPWIGEEPWRAHVRKMEEIERAGAALAAARKKETA